MLRLTLLLLLRRADSGTPMAESDHIKPLRLFDLSQAENDFRLSEEERQHLHVCEECQDILAVFARQFSKQRPSKDKPGAA